MAPGVHRYSCAYFTVPAWDTWVTPLKAPTASCSSVCSKHCGTEGVEKPTPGDLSTLSVAPAGAAEAATTLGTSVPASAWSGSLPESSAGVQKRPEGDVLVTMEGCRLAPGVKGVRVVDYIKAKYRFHSIDVGKPAAVQGL